MDKKKLIIIIVILFLILALVLTIKSVNKNVTNENNDIVTNITGENTNLIEEVVSNKEAEMTKKVMLSRIISDFDIDKEGYVLNEIRINSIIDNFEFRPGVYISKKSRTRFLKMLYDTTKINYKIGEDGYLLKAEDISNTYNNEVARNINSFLDSDKIMFIDIDNIYYALFEDEYGNAKDEIAQMMVERLHYVVKRTYTDSINVFFINSFMLDNKDLDLTPKLIGEEMMTIFI